MTSASSAFAQLCEPDNPYDNLQSSYHTSIVKEVSGSYRIWGERADAGGENPELTPTALTPANGYTYGGSILFATTGSDGNNPTQHFILSTTHLYAWGEQGIVVDEDLTSSEAFQAITPAGSSASGLPAGVNPTDVRIFTATRGALSIVTHSGDVYVLGSEAKIYGDNDTSADAVWHHVSLAPSGAGFLTNVVQFRASYRGAFAITANNEWYTWGDATYLGTGGASAHNRATLMTKPGAFTSLSQVKMIAVTSGVEESSSSGTAYYVINATDTKIYALGENADGNLGRGNETDQASWVNVRNSSNSADLTNVKFISAQEHDGEFMAVAAILENGTLLQWGANDETMSGQTSTSDITLPTLPLGFTAGNIALYVEVGGHTSVYVKDGSDRYCYIGHHNDGSMGDGDPDDTNVDAYDCSNTGQVNICGATGFDSGDVPEIYENKNPATHTLITPLNLRLGTLFPTSNNLNLKNVAAGADNTGTNGDGTEEDGLATIAPYHRSGTYCASVSYLNNTGGNAILYAWIDWDNDGKFEEPEKFVAIVPVGTGSVTATWTGVATDMAFSTAYMRVRLTSQNLTDIVGSADIDERSIGNASNGEVEDYRIAISNPPIANDDNDTGNTPGENVTLNLLTNDDLADGSQATVSGTTVTLLTIGLPAGSNVTGNVLTVPGEGTWTFDPATGNVTFDPQAGFNSDPTVITYSLTETTTGLSDNATVTVDYNPALTISGTVLNDVNGLNGNPVNTVDGIAVNGADIDPVSGMQAIYASLVQGGAVLSTVAVGTGGTYTFPGLVPGNYSVVLTTDPAGSVSSSLPDNWVNTGENIGLAAGSDGSPNGVVDVTLVTADVQNINFGIEQIPVAGNGSNTTANVNGNVQITVPLNTFTNVSNSTDPAPGNVTQIVITSIPAGAASIVINGITYDAGNPIPPQGISISTDDNGLPVAGTSITVDPANDGPTSVSIPFVAVDEAGLQSANTGAEGTAVVNLTAASVTIAGTVWNDSNGNIAIDGTEAGTEGGSLTLTAYLVDNLGNVVSNSDIAADGTYLLINAISGSTYTVVLSNTSGVAPGSTAPSASLANSTWINTGETLGVGNGAGTGTETITPGVVAVNAGAMNITGVNFGIERLPESDNKSGVLTTQPVINQSVPLDGTVSSVPTLSGSDPEDQPVSTGLDGKSVAITSLPTAGELWYGGLQISAASQASPTVIAGFDPSLLELHLTGSGYTTTSFTYAYVDLAGQIDPSPATYTLSWSGALPVRLARFEVRKEARAALLTWSTAEESGSDEFQIERSLDGTNWQQIGAVKAVGESKTKVEYQFTDSAPAGSTNLYRLKMIDFDGTFAFSSIREVSFPAAVEYAAWPNPASDFLSVQPVGVAQSTLSGATLFDISGRLVLHVKNPADGKISVNALVPGIYLVQVATNDGKIYASKVLIRR